jgi:hypothetical protein
MSRDHAVISAKDILLWFLVGLNVIVILTAVFTNFHWFWALSVTNSLAILIRYTQKRERQSNEGSEEQPEVQLADNHQQAKSKHTS